MTKQLHYGEIFQLNTKKPVNFDFFFLLQDTQTVKNGAIRLVQHILPKVTDKQETEQFILLLCNKDVPGSLCLIALSTERAQT